MLFLPIYSSLFLPAACLETPIAVPIVVDCDISCFFAPATPRCGFLRRLGDANALNPSLAVEVVGKIHMEYNTNTLNLGDVALVFYFDRPHFLFPKNVRICSLYGT